MKKIKSLYLAHAFSMLKEIKEVEKEIEEKTGIELINPFYDIEPRDDLDKHKHREFEEAKKLVDRDLKAIGRTDGILAIADKNFYSIGTWMEIEYAWLLKHPIFLITNDIEIYDHPWVVTMVDEIFKNKEEFIEWIKSL